jgi:hypothetical protein
VKKNLELVELIKKRQKWQKITKYEKPRLKTEKTLK